MCARIIYANSLYVMLTVKFKYWTLFFSTLRFQLPWISNERNPELRTDSDHYSIGTLKSVQMAKISHCQVDWNGSQWLILICHLLLIKFAENENAVADVWKCQFFFFHRNTFASPFLWLLRKCDICKVEEEKSIDLKTWCELPINLW